ncbi:MAG: glycosyltransferase family 2 protein, partial [Chloroflexaceae bacterium]|nr:glycosyltransferase family 2 protein [Chloroflexaceae bacterium]
MKVGLIVLTWNAAETAVECLKTVVEQQRAPDYMLVVDNASSDGTADRIAQEFPDIRLIRNPRNLGFSGGMNVGIRTLQDMPKPPDIVALLNQDTLLDHSWLGAIVAPFEGKPHLGAVGSKIRYPDGTIQHAGAYLKRPRRGAAHGWHEPDTGQYDDSRPYDLVTGAASP